MNFVYLVLESYIIDSIYMFENDSVFIVGYLGYILTGSYLWIFKKMCQSDLKYFLNFKFKNERKKIDF